jgi:hypothetical protein
MSMQGIDLARPQYTSLFGMYHCCLGDLGMHGEQESLLSEPEYVLVI